MVLTKVPFIIDRLFLSHRKWPPSIFLCVTFFYIRVSVFQDRSALIVYLAESSSHHYYSPYKKYNTYVVKIEASRLVSQNLILDDDVKEEEIKRKVRFIATAEQSTASRGDM